jgi:hypothetical protein
MNTLTGYEPKDSSEGLCLLTPLNPELWFSKTEAIAMERGLAGHLNGSFKKELKSIDPNTGKSYKDGLSFIERTKFKKEEKSLQGLIIRRCSSHFQKIAKKKKTAHGMWKALKREFRNRRPQSIGTILHGIVNDTLKEGEDVLEFIARKENLAAQLRSCGEKLSKQLIAWMILNTIRTKSLLGVRQRILSRRRISINRVKEDLKAHLQQEELDKNGTELAQGRVGDRAESQVQQVLVAQGRVGGDRAETCSYPACVEYAGKFKDTRVRHAEDKCYYNPESPLYDPRKKAKSESNTKRTLTLRKPDVARKTDKLLFVTGGRLRDFTCTTELNNEKLASSYSSRVLLVLLTILLLCAGGVHPHFLPTSSTASKLDHKILCKSSEETQNQRIQMIESALKISGDQGGDKGEEWILDTGATSHMTFRRERFQTYRECTDGRVVQFGDATKAQVVGTGRVQVGGMVLDDVLHIPSLKFQLISLKQLTSSKLADYAIFASSGGKLIKNSKVITLLDIKDGLYCLNQNFITVKDTCLQTAETRSLLDKDTENSIKQSFHKEINEDDRELLKWHHKLGHASRKTLKALGFTGELPFCGACSSAKIHQKSYKNRTEYTGKILGRVHSDIQGPYMAALDNSRHWITFVDEASRRVEVFVIHSRGEALDCYKKFRAKARSKFSTDICVLRTDGAKEYHSIPFNEILEEDGTIHETTLPYLSPTNGLAERINRSLLERARCFLAASGLGIQFWHLAILYAAHTYNLSPHSALGDGKCPNDIWNYPEDTRSKRDNLEIFGSVCYILPGYERRPKLDQPGIRSLFLGIDDNGYVVLRLDSQTAAIEVARTAIFSDAFLNTEEIFKLRLNERYPETSNPDPDFQDPVHQTVGAIPNEKSVSVGEVSLSQRVGENNVALAQRTNSRPKRKAAILGENTRRSMEIISEEYALMHIYALMHMDESEPRNVKEAMSDPNWTRSMKEELGSLSNNGTWELVDEIPEGKKPIPCMWIWKLKRNPDGGIERYKSRLVALGNHQNHLLDYDETFSPVLHRSSLRYLLNIAARLNLELWNMDVDTAFLNSYLEDEEIFMRQPPGFEDPDKPHAYCRLIKSIYGLKQANRVWNQNIDGFLVDCGFLITDADPCLYVRKLGGGGIILVGLYVDDLLIASNDPGMTEELKSQLKSKYSMKDLGRATRILNMEIGYCERYITLSQGGFIQRMIERYDLKDSKAVSTPMEVGIDLETSDSPQVNKPYRALIGELLYVANNTRPDVSFAVSNLARYSQDPRQVHWRAALRIVRYLKGTINLGLQYERSGKLSSGSESLVRGYSDADWGGCKRTCRSTSGYIFLDAGPISWRSNLQTIVALSTMEAEVIALSAAGQELMWIRKLEEAAMDPEKCGDYIPVIYEDNQSAIAISKNPTHQGRTKHMRIKDLYIRERVAAKEISVVYCSTKENVADIFTKPLGRDRFELLRGGLGIGFVNKGSDESSGSVRNCDSADEAHVRKRVRFNDDVAVLHVVRSAK